MASYNRLGFPPKEILDMDGACGLIPPRRLSSFVKPE